MVERRLTCLAVIVLLWGAAILKNLISLQIFHHREYAVRARSIQEVVEEIPMHKLVSFSRFPFWVRAMYHLIDLNPTLRRMERLVVCRF